MDAKQNYLNINLKGGRIIKVGGITASLAPLAVAVALLAGSGVAYAQLTGVVTGGTGALSAAQETWPRPSVLRPTA